VSRFVVQLHDATRLHFDFRLQSGEVLRSWAVPKGPSLDPRIRRLAVPVEDHPMSAGDFEGVHDGQARGTGAVIVWDEGTAEIVRDEPGQLSFVLHGRKLSGRFALTRTGDSRWILIKVRDDDARPGSDIVAERPESVRSGRTWQELVSQWRRLGRGSCFPGRLRVARRCRAKVGRWQARRGRLESRQNVGNIRMVVHYPQAWGGRLMSVTQIDIDDDALERAMALSGAKTKKEAVNLALQFYADKQARAARIARHFERARHWGALEDAERLHRAEKEIR